MNYKVYNIKYDVDYDDSGPLPTKLTFEIYPQGDTEDEVEELLSNAITDYTGWCHNGFDYEKTR